VSPDYSSSFLLLLSLEISDTKVYEPQIRALLLGRKARGALDGRARADEVRQTR